MEAPFFSNEVKKIPRKELSSGIVDVLVVVRIRRC